MISMKAGAVPVIGQAWGTGGNVDPVWSVVDTGGGNTVSPATVSGSSAVTLTFANGGFSPSARITATDPTYVGAGVNYLAALATPFNTVSFTFNPSVDPVALRFYFMSGANDMWIANGLFLGSGTLTYSLNIGSVGMWTHNPILNSGMTWDTGFASVTQIGFEVFGPNGGATQTYTFSNIELSYVVPEPETLWMIMMVLASLGITFRGRLAELAGQVKARIKA